MIITCKECNFTYLNDLEENITAHEKRHKLYTDAKKPKINNALKNAVKINNIVFIDKSSPEELHLIVYKIALAFKIETSSDSLGWEKNSEFLNSNSIAAIITDNQNRPLGAAVFDKSPYNKEKIDQSDHMLSWVWIAPPYRSKGVLQSSLPTLVKKFPKALILFPYSEGMKKFAEKSILITDGQPYYFTE